MTIVLKESRKHAQIQTRFYLTPVCSSVLHFCPKLRVHWWPAVIPPSHSYRLSLQWITSAMSWQHVPASSMHFVCFVVTVYLSRPWRMCSRLQCSRRSPTACLHNSDFVPQPIVIDLTRSCVDALSKASGLQVTRTRRLYLLLLKTTKTLFLTK